MALAKSAGPVIQGQSETLVAASYLENRIDELNSDLTRLLSIPQPVDEREDLLLRAQINTRRLAIELLQKGIQFGPDGVEAGLAGLRVARGLLKLDKSLQRAAGDERVELIEAREFLQQFNDAFDSWIDRFEFAKAQDLDAMLTQGIESLSNAIHLIEASSPTSHWIMVDEVVSPSTPTITPPAPPLGLEQQIATLQTWMTTSTLSESMRSSMKKNIEYLTRGFAFEEFHARVSQAAIDLARLLTVHETLTTSMTLDEQDRNAYERRIEDASAWFGDPKQRDRAWMRIARLEASVQVEAQLAKFKDENASLPSLLMALRRVETDIDEAGDDEWGIAAIRRYRGILQVMIDFRGLELTMQNREIRQVRASMLESFQRAESSIIDQLDRFLGDEAVMSDPSMSSLLAHQQHIIEDLKLIEQVDDWLEAIGQIGPRARRNVLRRLRIVIGRLAEPARRNEAAMILKQFGDHVTKFVKLPLESELRRSMELATLTGGLHDSLSRKITTTRTSWTEILERDLTGGEEAERLANLHRLMQSLEQYISLTDLEESQTLINRWAGWTIEPIIVERPQRELPLRFKLATAAAIEDLTTDLQMQLNAIEMDLPLMTLINELAMAWRPQLEVFSGGASGVLDALLIAPAPAPAPGYRAWLYEQRGLLAKLCLEAHEREHARTTGQGEKANSFAQAVNQSVMQVKQAIPHGLSEGSSP
ncbi:MAG: hypothetical protein O7G85_17725 [Planctomycetota bacterium]|nr:hypothetical protein [Planctomycetota bacterium]